MLFAAEGGEGTATGAAAEAVAHTSGWFLEHAWLIPVGPLVAFFLIIFFGKRTRKYSSGGAYFAPSPAGTLTGPYSTGTQA